MENQHQITVADLNALKEVIDLACTRGAFRANEMQQVGELYIKLSNFLEAVVAQSASGQSEEDQQGE